MNTRDKIADIIRDGELQMITYQGIADAIVKALPDYDAQQARIKELESALRTILQIPNSDAAQGIMKAFAEDALGEIK